MKSYFLLALTLCSFFGSFAQRDKAYFASGCFWCVEAIFEAIPGVIDVKSGYCGGKTENPTYREICTGLTGHAEAVEVTFNRKSVSYETLLEVFFYSHDPTTLNRQGPDVGTQYRSAIFYVEPYQKAKAEAFISQLLIENKFKRITTSVEKMNAFYKAENYHQDFEKNNPTHPYVNLVGKERKMKFLKKYKNRN
ncbi:peptide-methionine (S)-S-oxide reductase MsrA [Crocinitomicaceae bacterium]|nr:peptide-methionine (S)-S-oxide reductase MsrA [Crocinitomicaceae bacterium]